MSKISRFTKKAVRFAKDAVGGRGEVAAPEGGWGFVDYAVVSLHCLRVYLEKSYRESLDLLREMPQMLGEIGLDAADLPDHSTLVEWFDRTTIKRTLGDAVRARTWYGEFRELVLMCVVYDIKQAVS